MDKIPIHKLRRKPKPPAIETSIDRHPIGTALHLAPEAAAASKTSKSPIFASRLSPFRRLRGGKRARSCSPAASQLGEPVAAVVSNRTNSTNEQGEEPKLRIIPAFLTQSDQGKFGTKRGPGTECAVAAKLTSPQKSYIDSQK